jgi:glutathione reductase (NADPH)
MLFRPLSGGRFRKGAQRMSEPNCDLFIIGAGSGGVRAARLSAGFGARVLVAEESHLGGTCVNLGCIPKKLLVYASQLPEEIEEATAGYGWSVGERSFDWSTLIANKDREIRRLNDVYAGLLDESGVRRIEGRASLVDAHTIAVGERRYRAETILLAPGSRPAVPAIPGVEHAITSDQAFHLKDLPRKVVIVGGGYIAVEFAGIFHGMGAEVVQLYRGPLFLRGFDDDLRSHLAAEMRARGVDLRFDVNVQSIEKRGRGIRAELTDGGELEADQIMFATGRAPNTRGLGLEEVGVELDAVGAVVVDEYSRSSIPNIYAIGDATDRKNLTPVAIREGICFANTLYNHQPMSPDYRNVASAVFSQPPIGTVGLTESEARAGHRAVDVYLSSFRALKHTLTGSTQKTLMKLVVDRESQRVLGVHMVGPDAAEIIQGFAVALKCGATKAQFDDTIGVHPTAAEEFVTMRDRVRD